MAGDLAAEIGERNHIINQVAVKVRGKLQEAVITKMPFVQQRYFKAE